MIIEALLQFGCRDLKGRLSTAGECTDYLELSKSQILSSQEEGKGSPLCT